jgi:hypothetical protein
MILKEIPGIEPDSTVVDPGCLQQKRREKGEKTFISLLFSVAISFTKLKILAN